MAEQDQVVLELSVWKGQGIYSCTFARSVLGTVLSMGPDGYVRGDADCGATFVD